MSVAMQTSSSQAKAWKMYIDGEWVEASGGKTYRVPNPATEELLAPAPDASREDMRRAIAAARRAFDEGPWSRSTPQDRARVLRAIADAMEARKEEMRELLIAEAGACYVSHDTQVEWPIRHLRNYADLALSFPFEQMLPRSTTDTPMGSWLNNSMVHNAPVGVCGLIPTWNFPVFVIAQKIGPALATGNTMVIKPSPYGPLINLWLAEVIEEAADLPRGVINWVTGQGAEISQELVSNPAVDKISFTGSIAIGSQILAAAAPRLRRVHLELGGKSAHILLDGQNLDMVAPGLTSPAFFHSGQGCAMGTRVLVPRAIEEQAIEKMAGFVGNRDIVKIGNPADPSVLMGPVIREERRRAIEGYIESGVKDGARLITGGKRPAGLDTGYFLEPTIFAGVKNHFKIAQEEIFGPVVAITAYDDLDEAVRIANDSDYGLAAMITGSDQIQAVEVAKRLRTGSVWINNAGNMSHGPFGGFKLSGIGREGGMWGMHEYCEIQHIAWKS
ncbi:MAG TPA: aldehyde dehydrogenase family protein [Candidatus Bathyarchaeia archaeon]|nr:aldehyde dehydrogenase family protein [Candidatus Bathyarchaeia archaeon]